MLRAIDREAIVREVYPTGGRVAHAPIPRDLSSAVLQPFRPTESKVFLQSVGLSGQTLPVYTDRSPVSLRIVDRIAADLLGVGIRVEVREVSNTLPLHRDGSFRGGLLLHAIRATVDGDPRRFWNMRTAQGDYVEERNDAFDVAVHDLVVREQRALYPERRQQLRERLLALVTERLPILPLVFASERVLVDPALQNWESEPDVRFGTAMEEWYFAEPDPEATTAGSRSPESRTARAGQDGGVGGVAVLPINTE